VFISAFFDIISILIDYNAAKGKIIHSAGFFESKHLTDWKGKLHKFERNFIVSFEHSMEYIKNSSNGFENDFNNDNPNNLFNGSGKARSQSRERFHRSPSNNPYFRSQSRQSGGGARSPSALRSQYSNNFYNPLSYSGFGNEGDNQNQIVLGEKIDTFKKYINSKTFLQNQKMAKKVTEVTFKYIKSNQPNDLPTIKTCDIEDRNGEDSNTDEGSGEENENFENEKVDSNKDKMVDKEELSEIANELCTHKDNERINDNYVILNDRIKSLVIPKEFKIKDVTENEGIRLMIYNFLYFIQRPISFGKSEIKYEMEQIEPDTEFKMVINLNQFCNMIYSDFIYVQEWALKNNFNITVVYFTEQKVVNASFKFVWVGD